MKIIAVVSRSNYAARFLVEMTDTELNVATGSQHNCTHAEVGQRFELSGAVKQVRNVVDGKARLGRTAVELRAFADALEEEAKRLGFVEQE